MLRRALVVPALALFVVNVSPAFAQLVARPRDAQAIVSSRYALDVWIELMLALARQRSSVAVSEAPDRGRPTNGYVAMSPASVETSPTRRDANVDGEPPVGESVILESLPTPPTVPTAPSGERNAIEASPVVPPTEVVIAQGSASAPAAVVSFSFAQLARDEDTVSPPLFDSGPTASSGVVLQDDAPFIVEAASTTIDAPNVALTSAPEPATLGLVGVGMIGLAAVVRRRRAVGVILASEARRESAL